MIEYRPASGEPPVPPGVAEVPGDWVPNTDLMMPIFLFATPVVVAIVGVCAWLAWKDRTPLPIVLLLSSLLCVFIEPLGDVVGGIYLPKEAPLQMFTLHGRPMPVMDLYMWSVMTLAYYFGYKLIQSGASIRTLAKYAAAIGVAEVAAEIFFVQADVMLYFSNHALIFGVPVYTIVQNVGLCFVAPVALHLIMPYVRGARWLLLLWFCPAITIGYIFPLTIPAYLQVNNDVPALVGWALALLSTFLCAYVAYAALRVPSVARLRQQAAERAESTPERVPA